MADADAALRPLALRAGAAQPSLHPPRREPRPPAGAAAAPAAAGAARQVGESAPPAAGRGRSPPEPPGLGAGRAGPLRSAPPAAASAAAAGAAAPCGNAPGTLLRVTPGKCGSALSPPLSPPRGPPEPLRVPLCAGFPSRWLLADGCVCSLLPRPQRFALRSLRRENGTFLTRLRV